MSSMLEVCIQMIVSRRGSGTRVIEWLICQFSIKMCILVFLVAKSINRASLSPNSSMAMEGFLQQHLVQQQNSIISHFEILDVFFRMQGVSAKQVGDKTRCDMQKSMYHSARFKRVRVVCPAVGACKGFGCCPCDVFESPALHRILAVY